MQCWQCGRVIELKTAETISRRDSCPQCDADLHSCRNCAHYDPTSHGECRENQAEWVRYKEKNNYCDYFAPAAGKSPGKAASGGGARNAFDDLFRK